jgi:cellulose synthase/poly-beta-1,6-N-acetylglucosamine synthase-like glycosyltransferase
MSIKTDRIIVRILEIVPGFVSWNLILFPYWGIIVIPQVVAYFILIFNVYWFYQSASIAVATIVAHYKMQAAKRHNWGEALKAEPKTKPVRHAVIIPTYKEPLKTLERTINSLKEQTLNPKQIYVVLAMEKKEPEEDRKLKVDSLKKTFKGVFADFFVTVHTLVPGEIVGKSSNERYSALEFKDKYIKNGPLNIKDVIVTSCDADHVFHKDHFAALTLSFVNDENRYKRFWQPAVLFYNNIWTLPALTRVPNTFMSIWNLSQLARKDRLINGQNYSLSFKLLDDAGYWDPDKIPEDWGIFFKSFFKVGGGVEVNPIYLPLYTDAAESTTTFKTLKSQYAQLTRWAWGVSDHPWIMLSYLKDRKTNFFDKTTRLVTFLWGHFLWPVNWFIITIGLTLPTLLNPAFGRTSLGYMVPQISSTLLTFSLLFLALMLIIDMKYYKPKRPDNVSFFRVLLLPLEFILMPITGLIFGALPGLDAHTRLMLGKYMEYKVTEKV